MVRISIIIPTYNEAKYIGKTLESIKKQGYKDIEVILADGNSGDSTRSIAKRTYKGIKVAIEPQPGIGRSCNTAAKIAKGELLLFIDADTSIDKGLLAAYDSRFVEDREVVAATGPIRPLEKTTLGIRLGFSVVSVYLTRFLIALGVPSIIGSNFVVTRSAFRKVGGFDPSLITYQDWDLSKRLGRLGKITFIADASARTSVRRVKKWGVARYFIIHTSNVLYYNIFHRARSDYEFVR